MVGCHNSTGVSTLPVLETFRKIKPQGNSYCALGLHGRDDPTKIVHNIFGDICLSDTWIRKKNHEYFYKTKYDLKFCVYI